MKRRVLRYTCSLLALWGISFAAGELIFADDHQPVNWKLHFVEPGETVWTIAEQSNVHHSDLRDVVFMIMDHNHVDNGTIKPGMLIEYPVMKSR